jgi:hypothetical protein
MGGASLEALKLRVLDLVGCACAGFRLGSYRPVADVLDARGNAAIWFFGHRRSIADALRTNVFMAHAAYMEDGSRSTGGHPSCVVTPVVLTVAASASPGAVTPQAALSAIAFGYEVFLRVGERAYPAIVERGFRAQPCSRHWPARRRSRAHALDRGDRRRLPSPPAGRWTEGGAARVGHAAAAGRRAAGGPRRGRPRRAWRAGIQRSLPTGSSGVCGIG